MGELLTFVCEGRVAGGEVFEDRRDDPVTIEGGRGRIIPAVEEALLAMEPGEERVLEIAAADAYGAYDPRGVRKAPVHEVPHAEDLPVGEYIAWRNPVSTKPIPAKVASVGGGYVELDLNHPLAGRDLVYWVRLIAREEA